MSTNLPPCASVLLVDDDVDTLETLEEVLTFEGIADVRPARTLGEADQLLATGFVPSAVVLDLALAGERGEVLLARLRADPVLARVPVIAVSGDHRALASIGPSVARTLLKPARPSDLVEALREVCRV
ncbi:MAG TPA: response regulator [Anaeromyxobacter sp.]|nr:response regulator [Anaeromyxobacter sp.]